MIQSRKPTTDDLLLYFEWTNDELVREFSYQQNSVLLENHTNWFLKKIASPDVFMRVFFNQQNEPVGQVRIEKNNSEVIIGVSVDKNNRGYGFGSQMIKLASDEYKVLTNGNKIYAYIKANNPASIKAFQKAGYVIKETIVYLGAESVKLEY